MDAYRYEDHHFIDSTKPVWNYSLFTEEDVRNFGAGTHYRLYEHFGNHEKTLLETNGVYFAVWAPNATKVTVMGEFNQWSKTAHPLFVRLDKSGIWEGFIPGVKKGDAYKYHIHGFKGRITEKADPFGRHWETRPFTATKVWGSMYHWRDEKWMRNRHKHNGLDAPWSVYEVHLASWMRPNAADEGSYNSYAMIAERLVPYVKDMGFTHVEIMPVMEYPYDGSWGYQGIGYFAPTSRFGTPEDFAFLVDEFHRAGIGVILDWVPSHFPADAHGLHLFDGTHTYEYADMRKGFHPDWNSYIFNYERGEVRSFLISSARYWCDIFHADGLRVDAVSSMLKLDYSREEGEWEPNKFGGNGNLEAIGFLQDLNNTLYRDFPDIQTIAEEATSWPGITKPTFSGGIGFGMKWMMGWMHDTLDFFKADPVLRKGIQDKFSFSMMYYYDENFMLPLSHDEVVHGKSPMIYKMPGDSWQKFANLRLMYCYMFTHPGGKLLFMGDEIGSTTEWNYNTEIPWHLLEHNSHRGVQACVRALNQLLTKQKALHELQFSPEGFAWENLNFRNESVVVYRRKGKKSSQDLVVILNLTPVVRRDFPLELSGKLAWKEIFNSDAKEFDGTGDVYNPDIPVETLDKKAKKGRLTVHLPPLGCVILK